MLGQRFRSLQKLDNFKAEIEVLAQGSIEFQEICEIQVPSGGNWMLIRPLDKGRQETMDFVVHTAGSP
jgi:hypothetical protein